MGESTHAPEGLHGYKCSKCSAIVENRISFIGHTKKCQKTGVLTCEGCSSIFSTKHALQKHFYSCVPYKYIKFCTSRTNTSQVRASKSIFKETLIKIKEENVISD